MVGEKPELQNRKGLLGLLVAILFLGGLRYLFPERTMTEIGLKAIANQFFAIALLMYILWISLALGIKLLRKLGIKSLSILEQVVFSIPLGLAVIAYAIYGIGLLGFLRVEVIVAVLILLSLISLNEMAQVLYKVWSRIYCLPREWKSLLMDEKILIILGGLVLILTLMQSLTPPWDYDGLMYHLQGPKLFLEAGRIFPVKDNWLLYYPFTPEMLFTIGMSVGCDTFAKLINMSFAVLLVVSTYTFTRRYLGRSSAWLPSAFLIGIPIFPIWASFAHCDMAWAVFQFLSIYAGLIWSEKMQSRWLFLSGLLMGFALGSKYMAFVGAAALGIWLVWKNRTAGWRTILINSAIFGGAALVVCTPWYLKNWIWTGSPVYPMLLPQSGEIGDRFLLWTDYMRGFGAPHTVTGFLMLPILVYTQFQKFGTFMGSIEIPSLLFPLALIYPFTRRKPILSNLTFWVAFCLIFWAIGVQQIRYLLPLYPALSIIAVYVLLFILEKFSLVLRNSVGRGLGYGMLCVTLIYSIFFFQEVRPLEVVAGIESKEDFLIRRLPQYGLFRDIRNQIGPEAHALMLWDGRAYYCNELCTPDIDHSYWPWLVSNDRKLSHISKELRDRGATHLLIDLETANFVARFDQSGKQKESLIFLIDEFLPACSRELSRADGSILVELTCP